MKYLITVATLNIYKVRGKPQSLEIFYCTEIKYTLNPNAENTVLERDCTIALEI